MLLITVPLACLLDKFDVVVKLWVVVVVADEEAAEVDDEAAGD